MNKTNPQSDIASGGMSHSLDLLKDTYNYNHWIYSLLRPFLGRDVVEIGSGCGNLARFLLDRNRLLCLEPLDEFQGTLRTMASIHSNLDVAQGLSAKLRGETLQETFDSAVCLNVLEHIEDDVSALEDMFHAVRPGGRLLLYVPAVPWAYGALDRELKHFRRYRRSDLKEKIQSVGFLPIHCRSVNVVGLFGWWWSARIMKETYIDPRKARTMDRLVPYLSAMENLIHPPIGQSLFIVGEKPSPE